MAAASLFFLFRPKEALALAAQSAVDRHTRLAARVVIIVVTGLALSQAITNCFSNRSVGCLLSLAEIAVGAVAWLLGLWRLKHVGRSISDAVNRSTVIVAAVTTTWLAIMSGGVCFSVIFQIYLRGSGGRIPLDALAIAMYLGMLVHLVWAHHKLASVLQRR